MSSQQMSTGSTAPLAQSHHSIPIDVDRDDMGDDNEVGLAEKPLSRFEKTLFALISG
jgi:hypothetical protein